MILILSAFSLISQDLQYSVLNKDVDFSFARMNEVVFFVFAVELILSSLFETNFIGSFFFYVDFISLISVIPDVQVIWDPIYNFIRSMDPDSNNIIGQSDIQRTGIATGASST
jgi:hypothetical protein